MNPPIPMITPRCPGKTVADYVAFAKAKPGAINFGTTGSGSAVHMPAAWLHQITGTSATFIHYKVASQRLLDVTAVLDWLQQYAMATRAAHHPGSAQN